MVYYYTLCFVKQSKFVNFFYLSFLDKVAGWAGNTCEKYTVDSSGYCDSTGTCISSCTQVFGQTRVPLGSCGSSACQKVTFDCITLLCFGGAPTCKIMSPCLHHALCSEYCLMTSWKVRGQFCFAFFFYFVLKLTAIFTLLDKKKTKTK